MEKKVSMYFAVKKKERRCCLASLLAEQDPPKGSPVKATQIEESYQRELRTKQTKKPTLEMEDLQ